MSVSVFGFEIFGELYFVFKNEFGGSVMAIVILRSVSRVLWYLYVGIWGYAVGGSSIEYFSSFYWEFFCGR